MGILYTGVHERPTSAAVEDKAKVREQLERQMAEFKAQGKEVTVYDSHCRRVENVELMTMRHMPAGSSFRNPPQSRRAVPDGDEA